MRALVKHAGKYLLLAIMLVCFGHVMTLGNEMNQHGTPVIYYLKEAYSLDTVQDMRKNDAELENYLPFTAVGSLDQQTFSNTDLGKTLTCTLTYIDGSSESLCSSTGELMEDDLTGCVLSTQAAFELFGERYLTGGVVTYNERDYIVRGVYEDSNSVVILPAETVFAKSKKSDAGSDKAVSSTGISGGTTDDQGQGSADTDAEAAFNKIVIKPGTEISGSAERTEYLQAFENRWGLNENKTDCLIYQRLAAFFKFLLPALILLVVWISAIRWLWTNRYRPFWLIAGVAALAVMTCLFFMICQTKPAIPADMIPNTWSDFDFWGEKITTFKTSIQHILFMDKSEIELGYFKPLTAMMGYGLVTVVLFFISIRAFRLVNIQGCYRTLIAVCVTELCVIYILHRSGIIIEETGILLYLWPYYVVGQFVFCKKKQKDDEKTVDLPQKTW